MAMEAGKLVEQQDSCRYVKDYCLHAHRSASVVHLLHRFAAPCLDAEEIWWREEAQRRI